jgi:(2Fe-2S) ferredoxin
MMKYRKHIFICTNEKDPGKKSCREAHGMALVKEFKERIKAAGIKDVRAQRAGCLDLCAFGPAAMVYPEGTCYGNLQQPDVEKLFHAELIEGKVLEEKKLDF